VERCQKKQKRSADHEPDEVGDQWDHRAGAADSQLVVSLLVGKRTYEPPLAVGQDAKDRLRTGHMPAIFTDAWASYESAWLEVFGRRYPAKGRGRREVIRWRQGLAYGQVKKRYQGGRVDRVAVQAVHGKARLEHVLYLLGYQQSNTRVVERHNGPCRLRNQRQVRKNFGLFQGASISPWDELAVGRA
jgi:hypothetical protein